MELSIQNCYGLEVLTTDGKKIGSVVNLIINSSSYEATLLVFPGLKSEWAFSKAGKLATSAGSFGTKVLQNALPELYDVVDAATQIQSEVISEVSSRTDRKALQIGTTYYCIPSANIDTIEENQLTVSLSMKECVSWYKNTPVSQEVELVFFDDSCYKGPFREITISLNLPAIRGALVYDPKGLSSRLTDVKFESSNGCIVGFDLKFRGEDKSIGIDFIKKDYDRFLSSIQFQEDDTAKLKTTPSLSETQKVYLASTKTETARRVFSAMNRPKTAEELAVEIGSEDPSALEKDLAEMEQQGALLCLTPDSKVNKQFYLTDNGFKVKQVLTGEIRFEDLV